MMHMYLHARIAGLIDQGDSSPQQQPQQQPSMHIYLSSQTDRQMCVLCVRGGGGGRTARARAPQTEQQQQQEEERGARGCWWCARHNTLSYQTPQSINDTHRSVCERIEDCSMCAREDASVLSETAGRCRCRVRILVADVHRQTG